MKFYIASRGSEAGIVRVRKVRDALTAFGHVFTHDWTIQMERNFADGIRDTDLSFDEKRSFAMIDRDAVHDADVVIYLEDEKSEGSAGEVCLAHAYGVFLVSSLLKPIPRCLWATLSNAFFGTDEEAVAYVLALAEKSDASD